jgi:hypothetical protein
MNRMIFVLSTGRTGTKFLAEYFNNNYPSITALHEPKPSYLLRLMSNAYVDGHVSVDQMVGIYHRQRRHILPTVTTDLYMEATGYLYGFVDVLDRITPDPIILHILRDPREFVRSAHNHGSHSGRKLLATTLIPYWYPPVRRVLKGRRVSSIGVSAAKWLLINQTLLERGPRHPNYHLIKFEDIFGPGNPGLRCICDVLGVPFVESGDISPAEKVRAAKEAGTLAALERRSVPRAS